MKRGTALISILLSTALLLSACGKSADNGAAEGKKGESSPAPAAAAEAETTEAAETRPVIVIETPEPEEETGAAAIEVDDEEPPEEGMVRSPLTNEWISAELAEKRPIAVMYPIDKKAQPQYGLNKVDVFYEMMEEGTMSRQMGIIQDFEGLDRIGNIRSVREYYIHLGLEWDPYIVHYGGPELYVSKLLNRADVDNINGVGGKMGSDYGAFYRIPKGSRSEHTAYTDGKALLSAISKAKFSRTHRPDYYQPVHYKFAPKSKQVWLDSIGGSVDAMEVDMEDAFPVTKSALSYNPSDGLYYKRIYGAAQKDGNTGEQLAFKNILIQFMSCTRHQNSLYLDFKTIDSGKAGYFITNGKMVHVTWTKESDYSPTRYYLDDGTEITLNTGKTMVFCIRPGQDSFTVDGNRFNG